MGWKEASTLMVMALKHKPYSSLFNYRALMLKRSDKSSFMPKGIVFPGGTVEPFDSSAKWLELFDKFGGIPKTGFIPENKLPPIFKKKPGEELARDISLRITAIRETFEETGILLARQKNNIKENQLWAEVVKIENLPSWRLLVQKEPSKFLEMCKSFNCVPDIWSLKLWSNWLTPPDFKKRFDTVFYTACLLNEPHGSVDETENQKLEWFSPERLLAMSLQQQLWLPPPQVYEIRRVMQFCMLEDLAQFACDRERHGCDLYGAFRLNTNEGMIFPLPGDDAFVETNLEKYENCNFEEARKQCTHLHRMEIFKDLPTRIITGNYVPGRAHIAPINNPKTIPGNSPCCKNKL